MKIKQSMPRALCSDSVNRERVAKERGIRASAERKMISAALSTVTAGSGLQTPRDVAGFRIWLGDSGPVQLLWIANEKR